VVEAVVMLLVVVLVGSSVVVVVENGVLEAVVFAIEGPTVVLILDSVVVV